MLIPTVDPAERLLFSHTALPGVYRAVARYGYMERVRQDAAFVQLLTEQARPGSPPISTPLAGSSRDARIAHSRLRELVGCHAP